MQRKEYQAITRIRRYYEDTEVAEQVSADIKLCYTHHIHKTASECSDSDGYFRLFASTVDLL